MPTPDQIASIRRLNDTARKNPGIACIANVTSGFHALPDADRFAALAAIVTFTKFDGDNDPYGEHDFGTLYRLTDGVWTEHRPNDEKAIAQTVFWKMDCYDTSLTFGSEAPWDDTQTQRVLTIMLASEY